MNNGIDLKSTNGLLLIVTENMKVVQVALVVRNPPANAEEARDSGSTPVLGRSPGVGDGNPLQFSSLENSTDRSLTGCGLWGREESEAAEYTHVSIRS